jgi:hypothetical protein
LIAPDELIDVQRELRHARRCPPGFKSEPIAVGSRPSITKDSTLALGAAVPIVLRYSGAAPNPTASAILPVPASKRAGGRG